MTGVEPALRRNEILSPTRLPIPPHKLIKPNCSKILNYKYKNSH